VPNVLRRSSAWGMGHRGLRRKGCRGGDTTSSVELETGSAPMRRAQIGLTFAATVAMLLFASAFAAAPRSCEGGLDLYFWLGVLTLVTFLVVPFVAHLGRSLALRLVWAVALGFGGVAIWVAGLFVANVRIICRLI